MPEDRKYVVENVTRGLTLATRVAVAGTSAARRRGLLGVSDFDAESGLWIAPCEAVHTFGMKVPLDTVFLDAQFQVRKLASHLKPWRISLCLSARSVLELRAGTIARTGTRPGDRLVFRRVQTAEEESPGSR
ncbi:MAG TPA: DUF192 domain-containing protein [Bryobacteraceae bacterium]